MTRGSLVKAAAIVGLATLVLSQSASQAPAAAPMKLFEASNFPQIAAVTPTQHEGTLRRMIPMLGSGLVQRRMLAKRDLTYLAGKRLSHTTLSSPERFRTGVDSDVAGDYYGWYGSQNEPSIAVSPIDSNVVLIFSHNEQNFSSVDNACSVYISTDGGVTFQYFDDVPLETTNRDGDGSADNHTCSDPVVRASPLAEFAPILTFFYFSFMDINEGDANDASPPETDKVQVQRRFAWDPFSDLGTTTAFDSGGTLGAGFADANFVDKEWVDVHTHLPNTFDGGGDQAMLYATATMFFADGSCGIVLNRSPDYAGSWAAAPTAPAVLSSTGAGPTCGNPTLVGGARPSGGPDGVRAIACWYDSETDGSSPQNFASTTSNKFDIRCATSPDRFTSTTLFTAANDVNYEAPFWLGPNESYHRWWGTMFPSIAIDHKGNGHLAFGADPTASKLDAESGNIYYSRSIKSATNPNLMIWTGKVSLTAGLAQGYPAVVAQRLISQSSPNIFVSYEDHGRSSVLGAANYNLIYDAVFRKSINGGGSFAAAVRASDASSLSDYFFVGDYTDAATNSRRYGRYHVVWTDRADKLSIFDYEDDVFSDRF